MGENWIHVVRILYTYFSRTCMRWLYFHSQVLKIHDQHVIIIPKNNSNDRFIYGIYILRYKPFFIIVRVGSVSNLCGIFLLLVFLDWLMSSW